MPVKVGKGIIIENNSPIGVPVGGAENQVLSKKSATNFDCEWVDSAFLSGIISGTYNYWNGLRLSGDLPVGSYIKITNADDEPDFGLVVRVTSANTIDPNGIAGYLNADYQINGEYTDVAGFIANEGVWRAANIASYTEGDVVIYYGSHYRVGAGVLNTDAPDASVNYTLLPKGVQSSGGGLFGYIEEWDQIIYNFEADRIEWRKDKRGNVINRGSVNTFQWGDDKIKVAQQSEDSLLDTMNNNGTIFGVDFGTNSNIDVINNSGSISFSINGEFQIISAPDNEGTIEVNLNGFNSGVSGAGNLGTVRTYLYNNSYMRFEANAGTILSRHYDQSYADFDNNLGDLYHIEVAKGADVQIALNGGYSQYSCKYAADGIYVMPSSESFSGKEITFSGSTFTATVDISTASGDLTLPDYAGIINLTVSVAGPINVTDLITSQPLVTLTKTDPENITFTHNIAKLLNNGLADRTLFIDTIDSITYKKNPTNGLFIENHYITFD